MGSRSANAKEKFLAERALCGELCKNGWTDRDAVWFLDSGGPNEVAAMRPYVKLHACIY